MNDNDSKTRDNDHDELDRQTENQDLSLEFEKDQEQAGVDAKTLILNLKEKLKKCELERAEYLQGWQKAKADYINARKQDELDQKEVIKFAESSLIAELIPILDSFETAFKHEDSWAKLSAEWQAGIQNIYNQLWAIIKNRKVDVIDPIGQQFDPATAEAVGIVETKNPKEDNIILEVLQKGYIIWDRLIRSARVKVGKLIS